MNKSSQSRFLARAARSPRRRCGTIGRTTGASASVWKQLLFVTLLTPALSVAEAADKFLIGFHQTALYCSGPGEWNAAASYAEYTHAKVSRGEIPWRCVEPNAPVNGVHSYNWSSIDGAINTLDVRGIKTVGMIMRPPSWANGSSDDNYLPWTGSESAWNAFVSKYATFAAAVAKRYKGKNVYYEIWNEPNERYFWHPAPETNRTLAIRRYGQPFTAARNAVLAQDPAAKVALGGITGLGAGCCIQGTAYIEGLMRNNVRFDYAGIHPYDDDSPNTHKQYDDNYDDVVLVYNGLQQYPAYRNVKLWLTETANYNSDRLGEKTQADYFEIIMQRADSGFEGRIPPGVIEMVHIFIDRDHPEFPGTGAFRSNSTPKQSPIVCGRTSLDGHLRPTRGSIGRSRAPLASATEF